MSERENCRQCNGTGRDEEHRRYGVRLTRDVDHLYCSIHGDHGWNYKHGGCPGCNGSGKATA